MRPKGDDEPPRRPRRQRRRRGRADGDRRQRPLCRALPQAFLRTAARGRSAAAQPEAGAVMIRLLLAFAVIAAATPALAEPLTVRPGETWLFTLDHGDPAHAHKVEARAAPARGEM